MLVPGNAVDSLCLQALVDVLTAGGCAELINLDLRGNSLSAEAEQLLVSAEDDISGFQVISQSSSSHRD